MRWTLPGLEGFQLKVTVAADTRTAVYEAFARGLGRSASDFVFVDTELWRSKLDSEGRLDWALAADSDVLLSLTGRPISVDASIDGGDRALRVSAVPFAD